MKHKEYPSIPRGSGQSFQEISNAYIFDKLDGRNVAVTWARKQGWQNFYTRSNRIFDLSDKDFGDAIPLFHQTFAEKLGKVFTDARYDGVTAYFELYQPVTKKYCANCGEEDCARAPEHFNRTDHVCPEWSFNMKGPYLPYGSLAGTFVPGCSKELALIDVAPYKQCLVSPKDFLKTYATLVPTASFLGQANWTRGFMDSVRAGQVEGISFEGCVGKAGDRHGLVMAKAKTQAWVDAVLSRYGAEEGKKIVES